MDNKEVRRRNIQCLAGKAGGPTALADALDRVPNQVSQWTGGKNIGDNLAREIERRLGKDPGWLDSPQWPGPDSGEKFQLVEGPSHPLKLDPDILHEAETLVLSNEVQLGLRYAPRERARQLCKAYELLTAEAGS